MWIAVAAAAELADAIRQRAAGLGLAAPPKVAVSSILQLHGASAQYDCPVVLVRPARGAGAPVAVELQSPDEWWVRAEGGPGTELPHQDLDGDLLEQALFLVEAVMAGRVRFVVAPGRSGRPVWSEHFTTPVGEVSSTHHGRRDAPAVAEVQPLPY